MPTPKPEELQHISAFTTQPHNIVASVVCYYKACADSSCAVQLTNDTIESAYSSVALHPDGQILGTGTEQGIIHVWETKSQNVGCSLPWLLLQQLWW